MTPDESKMNECEDFLIELRRFAATFSLVAFVGGFFIGLALGAYLWRLK